MVGREAEKAHLKSLLKSDEHEFVAVFGRRRIGKTYLVDKDFDKAMRRKVSDFIKSTQTKYTIHTTLVSANEVIDNFYAGNLQSIITAEDLFVN